MVKLVIDNREQITILEYLLIAHGIDYEIELNDGRWGIDAPYLIVYGAPLDKKRAIRWIRGQQEDCYYE